MKKHLTDDEFSRLLDFHDNAGIAIIQTNLLTFLQQEESVLLCFQGFQERTKSSISFEEYQ